jgi:predicted metal-dependent phosphotriesterase family hydrolase
MTNYSLGEGESVFEELKNNDKIVIGDTITYTPYNQQGYMKYKVIMGDNGKKTLEVIDSYDLQIEHSYNDDDDDSYQSTVKDDSSQSTVKYDNLGKHSYDDNDDAFTKIARYDEKGGRKKSRKGRKSRKSKKSKKGKKSRKGRKGRKSRKTRK